MKKFIKIYLITLFLISDLNLFAQIPDPDPDPDPPPTPINGSLILLAIIGIIYVYSFFRKRQLSSK